MKNRFFNYRALDSKGRPCAGSLKAPDEESALKELAGRGLTEVEVEENPEASSRVSERTLQQAETRTGRRNFRNELLSYAMPAAAALIALAGIPVMMHFIKPPAPEAPAVRTLEQYLELEKKTDFDGQFELLSSSLQEFHESPQAYVRLKRQQASAEGGFGKVSGMEALKESRREASFQVKVFRLTGLARLEIGLVLEKGRWKVDFVRDPRIVEAALEKISGLEGQARRIQIVALKNETGYSDLEIEAMLKTHVKRPKKDLSAA